MESLAPPPSTGAGEVAAVLRGLAVVLGRAGFAVLARRTGLFFSAAGDDGFAADLGIERFFSGTLHHPSAGASRSTSAVPAICC